MLGEGRKPSNYNTELTNLTNTYILHANNRRKRKLSN